MTAKKRKAATPKKSRRTGNPGYSDTAKAKIIKHVIAECAAGRPVSRILAEDPNMPASSCFWNWHYHDEDLQEKLARAREHGATALLDEAIRIADTPREGEIVTEEVLNLGGKKVPVVKTRREDMLGHRRLQVDTRIKAAQMIAPRKYGPKLDLTSGGEKMTMSAMMLEAERRLKAAGESH